MLLFVSCHRPGRASTPWVDYVGYTERVVRDVFADNLILCRAGQPLQNVVEFPRGR